MLAKRVSNSFSKRLGIQERVYKPIFQSFQLFTSRLSEMGIVTSNLLKTVRNLIITEDVDFGSLRENHEASIKKIIERAESYSRNEFQIFERNFSFQDSVNWLFSEKGRDWPKVHFSKIVPSVTTYGDIKYTWELNRLGFIQILAISYRLTEAEKYLKRAETLINSCLDSNPPEMGVNWMNDQELSYRMLSLVIALQLLGKRLSGETILKCFWFFLEAGRHIDHEIEFTRSCVKNNHMIGASTGLILSGILTAAFNDKASQWLKKGKKYLNDSVLELFNEDGSYKNQSINYQIVSTMFLLTAKQALNQSNDDSDVIEEVLLKSAFVLKSLSVENHVPQIGAWDSGKPIMLSICAETYIGEVLDAVFATIGISAPKTLLGTMFIPKKKNTTRKDIMAHNTEPTQSFENGLCRTGVGNSHLFFIGGGHPLYSQRHADYLSFIWMNKGEEIIGDSGNYKYNTEDIKWNHYFRSSQSHNCLIIDKKPFSEPYHAFRWLSYPSSAIKIDKDNCLIGTIESKEFKHTRELKLSSEDTLLISDSVTIIKSKNTTHLIQLFFHIPLGESSRFKSDEARIILNNGKELMLTTSRAFSYKTYEGSTNPISGWKSYYYGEKHPIMTIVLNFTSDEKTINISTELRLREVTEK
jgi:hypothetical protein